MNETTKREKDEMKAEHCEASAAGQPLLGDVPSDKEIYKNFRDIELGLVGIIRNKIENYQRKYLGRPSIIAIYAPLRFNVFQDCQIVDGVRMIYTYDESIFKDEHKVEVL